MFSIDILPSHDKLIEHYNFLIKISTVQRDYNELNKAKTINSKKEKKVMLKKTYAIIVITYIVIPLLLLTIISSCDSSITDLEDEETETTDIEQVSEVEEMKKFLAKNGFPKDKIEYYETLFIIDGDIRIPVEQIKSLMGRKGDPKLEVEAEEIPMAHQAYGGSGWGLVSMNNVNNITVRAQSNVPTAWRNAVEDATEHWNSVNGTTLNFNYISSGSADIVVYRQTASPCSSDEPSYVIASADPALSGNPGSHICINPNFDSFNPTNGQRVYNMVHELGHTIGFRHTNWHSTLPQPEQNANRIPATPTSDGNSVMNGGTADSEWDDFSTYDVVATKMLYPSTVFSSNDFSLTEEYSQGSIVAIGIEKNMSLFGQNSTKQHVYRKIGSGSWQNIGLTFTRDGPIDKYTNQVSLTPGQPTTIYYKLKGENTLQDIDASSFGLVRNITVTAPGW